MSHTRIKTQESITLGDKVVDFLLVRSKKRKYSLSMQIKKNGILQVNVPYATDIKVIDDFLQSKIKWVLDKTSKSQQVKEIQPLTFNDGDMHWYKGKKYRLKLIVARFSRVEIYEDNLLIYRRENQSIQNLLDQWFKQNALNFFVHRTRYYADLYDFTHIKEIKIRNMKARWGSCSSLRVITYNTHLIKAPLECIDYVVIHELCHLIHQNHQKGFYQLQIQLNPTWKQQKKKLDVFARNNLTIFD